MGDAQRRFDVESATMNKTVRIGTESYSSRFIIWVAVAGCLAAAMFAMWLISASNDSSTSGLVFVAGWILGVPAAIVLGIFAKARPSAEPVIEA